MPDITPEHGARNLLLNCAQASAGDRLLIAYEPPEYNYFDPEAVDCVVAAATDLGLEITKIDVGFNPDNPHLTPELASAFQSADIILFLSRLGDQLRFSDMPRGKKIIVSFALSRTLFGSGFANGHHAAFMELKDEVNAVLSRSETVRLSCRNGTDVVGHPEMNLSGSGDTTIMRFPMSVFTPVPAHSFSGRVALCGFLTGTGSKYYDDYTLEFDGPVFAMLQEGMLTGFEGGTEDVSRANAHYDRVSSLFNIDRNFVHSWHAGIHPGCGFPWDIRENYERWGGAAFGNPRILHFHTCGRYAPGEISWNVIDPSITVDGLILWEDGVFHAERLPNGPSILANYPCAAGMFANPDPEIGFRRAAITDGFEYQAPDASRPPQIIDRIVASP